MRIVTGFGSLLGFFYVFPRMPLVDAYAISYAAPLFMVALAAPMLGEVVGWRRWSAVAVGFVGVLVMLEPWNISVHWLSLVVLSRDLLLLAVDRADAPDQPLRPRCGDDLLVLPVRQRGVAGRRHPGVEVADARRLVLAESLGLIGGVGQILVTRACASRRRRSWRPSTTPPSCWRCSTATVVQGRTVAGRSGTACRWSSARASTSSTASGFGPASGASIASSLDRAFPDTCI